MEKALTPEKLMKPIDMGNKDEILRGSLVTAAKGNVRTYMVGQTVHSQQKWVLICEMTASHSEHHKDLMKQVCHIISK